MDVGCYTGSFGSICVDFISHTILNDSLDRHLIMTVAKASIRLSPNIYEDILGELLSSNGEVSRRALSWDPNRR